MIIDNNNNNYNNNNNNHNSNNNHNNDKKAGRVRSNPRPTDVMRRGGRAPREL